MPSGVPFGLHLVQAVGYAMAEVHQAHVVATTKGRVASLARVAPIHEAIIIVPHALMQNQVHHEAATLVQPTLVKEEELCLSD